MRILEPVPNGFVTVTGMAGNELANLKLAQAAALHQETHFEIALFVPYFVRKVSRFECFCDEFNFLWDHPFGFFSSVLFLNFCGFDHCSQFCNFP